MTCASHPGVPWCSRCLFRCMIWLSEAASVSRGLALNKYSRKVNTGRPCSLGTNECIHMLHQWASRPISSKAGSVQGNSQWMTCMHNTANTLRSPGKLHMFRPTGSGSEASRLHLLEQQVVSMSAPKAIIALLRQLLCENMNEKASAYIYAIKIPKPCLKKWTSVTALRGVGEGDSNTVTYFNQPVFVRQSLLKAQHLGRPQMK